MLVALFFLSDCDVAVEEQLQCGYNGISKEYCDQKGCCFDEQNVMSNCHYPLDGVSSYLKVWLA